jgi:hypothetical protein
MPYIVTKKKIPRCLLSDPNGTFSITSEYNEYFAPKLHLDGIAKFQAALASASKDAVEMI